MNNPDNMPDDETTVAYRRASDAQAGQPAPATRAAILAEARAANLRRTPAANDARYAWRAVAGVAVLGVAVLLWRQADRHVSPDLTVTDTELLLNAERGDVAEAPAAKAEMDEVRAPAPIPRERESKRAEESAGEAIASVAAPAANVPERASADAAPALASGALRQEATEHQGLLQREFPDIWSGDRIAGTAWVVMDADGTIVRKGVLLAADSLASVAAQSGAWTIVEVKTANGSSLKLAVMNTGQVN